MRVLQIGSDRSKRGSIVLGTASFARQETYAQSFGVIDDINFTLHGDDFSAYTSPIHTIYPTDSSSKIFYGIDALRIAQKLPRPDVVSAQDPFEAGLVAWRIARRFGAPLYVQVHTDFLSPEYSRHSLLNRVRILIAGFVLKRATRIRVVSERIKNEIAENYRPRAPITVLPIFVDVEKYRNAGTNVELAAKFARFKTKLLVVGRLEPEKNIELAIRSFAEIAPQDACLIIVGEGSTHVRLQALARTSSVSDRIFFEGEKDAAPYYKIADLVLVTSHYEGYGLVIVEALASGIPVLSTDVGVARESGAIVSNEANFAADLENWFKNGPRTLRLRNYPYTTFEECIRIYCVDIAACAKE